MRDIYKDYIMLTKTVQEILSLLTDYIGNIFLFVSNPLITLYK